MTLILKDASWLVPRFLGCDRLSYPSFIICKTTQTTRMDHIKGQSSNLGGSLLSHPIRPDFQTEWLTVEGYVVTYDAANFVQAAWMNWSTDVEKQLKGLTDHISRLQVPEEIMVGLIHKAGQLPVKPGVARSFEAKHDDFVDSLVNYSQRQIHQEWHHWADKILELSELVANRIQSERCCDNLLSGLNFQKLSISRPLLQNQNLGKVFQDTVDVALSRSPDTWMGSQRQVKTFLSILFEAEAEAEEMTFAEAEELFESMADLDVNKIGAG